ncbi:oxidoreductase [Haladaptatus sp. DJG-WS-42]|uniref:oxidoreductase n=1 Tax=Haladaptatus sp. DJG-WS-42 TaxID=3120516 RepID=UPI0030D23E1C
MTDSGWEVARMPDQTGKTVVVTGANSGIGFETARAFAQKGAHVVLACRSVERGQTASDEITAAHPDASLEVLELDLADLSAIHWFADALTARHDRLDVLVNNAGVMHAPYRTTQNGFELQFGVNHLGHFALTGLVLPLLTRTTAARVVTLSSFFQRQGHLNFEDLQSEDAYDRYGAYAQSKLANLLFAVELHRRIDEAGLDVLSVAAHPGWAATNLQSHGVSMDGGRVRPLVYRFLNHLVGVSPAQGASYVLYAATAPDVVGGRFYGPSRLFEMRGPPTELSLPAIADSAVATRLWAASEALTGIRYDFGVPLP